VQVVRTVRCIDRVAISECMFPVIDSDLYVVEIVCESPSSRTCSNRAQVHSSVCIQVCTEHSRSL
jgi:hypothetical protein